ncbi:MAG: acetyl-CoA carboxylase biotin carboxyl carrier protein [Bacillota bacterium]
MNIKIVKSLAQIMQSAGLTAIEVSEGDTKIRLEKNVHLVAAHHAPAAPAPLEPDTSGITERVVDFNLITEVKSPMVGVFYAAPAPDAEPFVKVGDRVKKGDVLCIIEAMKIMNEIVSETDGEIVDICVQNGQVVEYSQILFKIF